MIDDALYYEFEFSAGERYNYAGIWHYAKVTRVAPDADVFVDRRPFHTRWGAKRGARRMAKDDLAWLKARSQDEKEVWRP